MVFRNINPGWKNRRTWPIQGNSVWPIKNLVVQDITIDAIFRLKVVNNTVFSNLPLKLCFSITLKTLVKTLAFFTRVIDIV